MPSCVKAQAARDDGLDADPEPAIATNRAAEPERNDGMRMMARSVSVGNGNMNARRPGPAAMARSVGAANVT